MPAPSRVTVTAKNGPSVQATAQVLNNIQQLSLDAARGVLTVDGVAYDLAGVTTFTVTPSVGGTVYTCIIS